MTVLYLLIPMAMIFVLVAGIAFFMTIRSGQYDDMDGVSHRILMDDDDPRIPHNAQAAVSRRREVARAETASVSDPSSADGAKHPGDRGDA